jgi:hypothetical protein
MAEPRSLSGIHGGERRPGSPSDEGGGVELGDGIGAVEPVHLKLARERRKRRWSSALFHDGLATREIIGWRRWDKLVAATGFGTFLFIRLLLLCTSSERYCSFVDVMVYPDA